MIDGKALLTQPCDVLAPCAIERVIDEPIARPLQCRVLAEGANGPTTPEADRVLSQRNDEIFVIPDILCNAGGVIVSYFEWVQDLQQYFWSRGRSDGPAGARARPLLDPGRRTRPPRRRLQPHRRDGDRRRAGAQGEAGARAVSIDAASGRSGM